MKALVEVVEECQEKRLWNGDACLHVIAGDHANQVELSIHSEALSSPLLANWLNGPAVGDVRRPSHFEWLGWPTGLVLRG